MISSSELEFFVPFEMNERLSQSQSIVLQLAYWIKCGFKTKVIV